MGIALDLTVRILGAPTGPHDVSAFILVPDHALCEEEAAALKDNGMYLAHAALALRAQRERQVSAP